MSSPIRIARYLAKRALRKSWTGFCPICEAKTRFWADGDWYRDQLHCGRCWSIPRERAVMRVINKLYPAWRELQIHESSPSNHSTSRKLASECVSYTGSHYLPEITWGTQDTDGRFSQNLEDQTFADECFDLVVTQDVFEHLFRPDRAIAEITRTLKPGGAHIMSVPIVNKSAPSSRRARMDGSTVVHLEEPQFHGNPVGDGKSLVTVDWGYDIADYLTAASGCPTTIHTIDDLNQGIRAEFIEVVVTRKGAGLPTL